MIFLPSLFRTPTIAPVGIARKQGTEADAIRPAIDRAFCAAVLFPRESGLFTCLPSGWFHAKCDVPILQTARLSLSVLIYFFSRTQPPFYTHP